VLSFTGQQHHFVCSGSPIAVAAHNDERSDAQ
jgi:hypothetical protein